LSLAGLSSSNEGGSEGKPPPSSPPVERHPSNDDWGTTLAAIAVMSLIAFVALGILIKKSFQLVPTGVLALRTLVSDQRPAGYHQLDPNDDSDDDERRPGGDDSRRLEVIRDDDYDDDGGGNDAPRILHIRTQED
ncbi:hypothetical protein IWW38_006175, partial [Coemansia aciculifera]